MTQLRVVVYQVPNQRRSKVICHAMAAGIRAVGDKAVIATEDSYRIPEHDVAVFYGLEGRLKRVIKEYPQAKKHAVYVDLGYWGRLMGGKLAGFHKISVNNRHPTSYFQSKRHKNDRIALFSVEIAPWRRKTAHDAPILLAGMGSKAAMVEGFAPEQWERAMIAKIGAVTTRPVLYRPKPSWKSAAPIEGTLWSPRATPVEEVLPFCRAVVTHHSNVGVDALLAGVPVFTEFGVAAPLALDDLSLIETPRYPDGREQWASDVAYCQWSVQEMAEGLPWRHLKSEGIIP